MGAVHPLNGAWAKVARAERHLEELKADIARSPNYVDFVGFTQKFNADTSTIEITLKVPELPLVWSLMAADFAHNLRCALNYLVWELSIWNLRRQGIARDPDGKTQFPIRTVAPTKKNPSPVVASLPDVYCEHVERIQALQPHGAAHLLQFPEDWLRNIPLDKLTRSSWLAKLARLTNDDKHRTLPTTLLETRFSEGGLFTPTDCEITGQRRWSMPVLKEGAPWIHFPVRATGPGPKVEMHGNPMRDNPRATPEIAFGGCTVEDELPAIGETVAAILTGFESVF